MQSYDYSKLLGLMRERGFTQEKLAKTIGISECSMNFSLNNKRNFRQDEISKISGALGIPVGKIEDYFFNHNL
jgi:transcriptional regulator with XRE-family HTH domain